MTSVAILTGPAGQGIDVLQPRATAWVSTAPCHPCCSTKGDLSTFWIGFQKNKRTDSEEGARWCAVRICPEWLAWFPDLGRNTDRGRELAQRCHGAPSPSTARRRREQIPAARAAEQGPGRVGGARSWVIQCHGNQHGAGSARGRRRLCGAGSAQGRASVLGDGARPWARPSLTRLQSNYCRVYENQWLCAERPVAIPNCKNTPLVFC